MLRLVRLAKPVPDIQIPMVCLAVTRFILPFPASLLCRAIGADIGNQVSFKAVPDAETASFVIPGDCVGFFIQVTATRRVENQVGVLPVFVT